MTIQSAIAKVEQNYAHQPEFIQAVKEVAMTIEKVYADNPKFETLQVFERLCEPDRIISFRVNWENDKGEIQVNRGWRVQFSNAIGPYKGGIRFHPTVTEGTLKFLGFEQIFKNALTGLPMGGAKGGSDFDPKGKSEAEIRRFCYAFMRELHKNVGKDMDVPAGDIGVGGREVNYMFAMYKNLTREFEGVLTGKGVGHGGSLIRTEATGYGLVYFLDNMLKVNNDSLEGKTVLVSGAGNVAQYAAEKCLHLGGKVITFSDSKGTLVDKDGFTAEKIDWVKNHKANGKALADYVAEFGGEWLAGERPWQFDADVALPCATQNEVSEADAHALVKHGVKYVAEGANMPLTAEAIDVVREHGVAYAPGKAANAGGVAVSGLEMSQNSVRKYKSFEDLDLELQKIMKNIHESALEAGKKYGTTEGTIDYMTGANVAGFTQVANALVAYGYL
ncbi:NADP-specific glutamate dehydrogenase [Moraxella bovis]|uniref:Glutamate dehydrogenase n=1 Tax=Moraxella bovis TaxID=476 RepID=A0A1T0A3H4_MORBO|nr:NADP-specific glutamate dehydrogenase [Moraxella bovis]OOR90277.1 glutamate dehydrogenase [Moraxella bovis]UYZ68997.1 NADP-specific glutamate dehydrogenase [Moraxella bovis]UYZ71371.1 NADP-specific glutamate dehydrogenase [Moraxella bovis]UYZ72716.1 NADP-specific glutamate dehydrogenase [Moraxella bovis]UZA14664.1 NADP-specific glutamate dehydrogenase [Moraxella bovis]